MTSRPMARPECRFGWGTTEAMVWQGTEGRVPLQKGLATVSLTIDAAGLSPLRTAPMRNVDVVVPLATSSR